MTGPVGQYNPDQPRVPAGSPEGGEWGGGAGGGPRGRTSVTPEQLVALGKYSRVDYQEINTLLRKRAPPADSTVKKRAIQQMITQIDAAFSATPPFTKPVTLYRGMRIPRGQLRVGQEFTDRGFVSTSRLVGVATRFGGVKSGTAVVEIVVPKGGRGLDLTRLGVTAGDPNEHEVLLPRGTRFRVTRSWPPRVRVVLP